MMFNPLLHIMDVNEAAELWGLNPDYVKRLCQQGKLKARKMGQTWILDKHQPNPKQRERG